MVNLRYYQEDAVSAVRESFRIGNRRTLLVLPTGGGKCYGAGTPIMLHDGTIKPVENVVVGDLLMGPDSTPRRVESLARGREEMFRITPVKGAPFECNRSHILCLDITPARKSEAPTKMTMTVEEYLGQSNTFKHRAKLWRTGVDFTSNKSLPLPAYQLGLWLGDGTNIAPQVSCPDPEVLYGWAEVVRLDPSRLRVQYTYPENGRCPSAKIVRVVGTEQDNLISTILRNLGLMETGSKHIPHMYKVASREDRLALLAGIIDTDGYLGNNFYEVSTIDAAMRDDILFVARSLGLAAYSSTGYKKCQTGAGNWYHRIAISGDIDQIPCRVPRKKAAPRKQIKRVTVTGFSVESLGEGDYYGFVLSGPDRMHLLGDFTVGHNTMIFSYIAAGIARNNKRVLIIAHRRELLRQISKALSMFGVKHAIMAGGARGIPTANVVVASVFTLANRLKHFPAPDLIIGDESHHLTPDSTWGKVVQAFPKARVLGVTATPERLDGKGLGLLFDDMVVGPSVAELTEQGFLSPAEVYAPSKPELASVRTRMGDYVKSELEGAMDKPSVTGSAVAHYQKLANGKKAIAFCVSVKHAEDVAQEFRQAGYRAHQIDGGMTVAERDRILKEFEAGRIEVLTSCDLVSEGFDLPAVEVVILLRPTKSLSLYLQQVGRGIRIAPGKSSTIVLDHANNTAVHGFIDEHREWVLTADSARKKSGEVAAIVRTCPACFSMHRPTPVCPKCGHVYEIKARKIEQKEGELVQISRAEEAQKVATEQDIDRRYNILSAIARKRGYNHPEKWAYNVICGQEASRLAKLRGSALQTTNGLTVEERSRIWNQTIGRRSAA